MAVFRSCGTMPVVIKRCVEDVHDGQQENVKVFIKKRGGSGIKFTRLVLIIFKTGSKFRKGFPAKEVLGQAVGFGGGKLFLMVQILSVK